MMLAKEVTYSLDWFSQQVSGSQRQRVVFQFTFTNAYFNCGVGVIFSLL
jgi:hypothetical protein